MILVDYIILGVVVISAIIGLFRGFLKEALSLATWVAAILVAKLFASNLANLFADRIDAPIVRVVLAGGILFVGVLILGAVVNYVVSVLVEKTGLSGTDRTLGMVFGAIRGMLINALVLVVAVAWVSKDQLESWRQESTFVPYLEQMVVWMRGVLPKEVGDYLQYEDVPELPMPDLNDANT
ncbi:MAG: CvpA family protein [Pseudomonadota bacterium]